MIDMNQDISNFFQSTQILLVFVTFLFTLFYPQIQEKIHSRPPDDPKKINKHLWELKQTLMAKCFLLLFINGFVLFICLQFFYQIFFSSLGQTFSFIQSTFIFISLLITIFFVWSAYLTYELIQTIRKVKDNAILSVITTIKLFLTKRIQFPEIMDTKLLINGHEYTILKKIEVKPKNPEETKRYSPALLLVDFSVKMDVKNYSKVLLLTIPFFVGLYKFRSSLWAIDINNSSFKGIYQWDNKENAKKYTKPQINRFLAFLSDKNSISIKIIPNNVINDYLTSLK